MTETSCPGEREPPSSLSVMTKNKDYLAYHKVDPVSTPLGEKIFMAAATGLVLVGLPLALAAIFHFVLPLIAGAWVN